MSVLVISAPHTGTRFMRGLLGGEAIHSFDYQRINACKNRPVVVPLRRPESVWESYCARRGTGHAVTHGMEESFKHLLHWDEVLSPFYCPVDLGDRSKELSDFLGREVGWSSEKVGHYRKGSFEVPEKDFSWFYELPFIKKFYA